MNYYHIVASAASPGKEVVRLGLDETSIECYSGKCSGNVFLKEHGHVRKHLPKQKRRKCLTLVLTAAEDPAIQACLPGFLIGNCNAFLKREMHLLESAAGCRLELIRRVRARAFIAPPEFCIWPGRIAHGIILKFLRV